jgi:thymidylate kinase
MNNLFEPQLIIVTGPDRCGKSTIIKKLDGLIHNCKKFNIHCGSPPKLQRFPNGQMDPGLWINRFQATHYVNLIQEFTELVTEKEYVIICDRFFEGEYVYGRKFRDQKIDDNIFEHHLNRNKTKLILMEDSIDNIIKRQDGLSIEKDRSEFEDVQNRFNEFFDKTYIHKKMKLNLRNASDEMLINFLEL